MNYKIYMHRREQERAEGIKHVTRVGLAVNLLLVPAKLWAGYAGNSRAVVADGVHSISDFAANLVVLIGVRYWTAPPSENHPYGYRRMEALISFCMGALLVLAGIGIVYDAAVQMFNPSVLPVGGTAALAVTLFSVVSKEILYRWTAAKGKELKSDILAAGAAEHRADALSSIPVLITVAVAMWFPYLAALELLGAALVALLVVRSAVDICRQAVHTLLDGNAGPEVNKRIQNFTLGIDGVKDIHNLRSRLVGQGLLLDMHVSVDETMSLSEAHETGHRVEEALYTPEAAEYIGREIMDALVHIDPWPQSAGAASAESAGGY
ncbi:MAG: cation diffusion facilitator family transporter [Desulfovibrio sp.]|jgi:cation diffusion facilitator family transporter|nr:cation diffusion facilitator family transporter [Desulfovibrio sp.]